MAFVAVGSEVLDALVFYIAAIGHCSIGGGHEFASVSLLPMSLYSLVLGCF